MFRSAIAAPGRGMIPSHKLDVGSMKRTLVAHGLLRLCSAICSLHSTVRDQVSETLLAKARQRLAHCERTGERIERLVAFVNLLPRDVAQQRLRFFDSAPALRNC